MKRVPQRGNSLCKGLEVREFMEKEDMKNSSSWLEYGLGSKDWDEAEEGKRSRTVQGSFGAHGGSHLKTLDSIQEHWLATKSFRQKSDMIMILF